MTKLILALIIHSKKMEPIFQTSIMGFKVSLFPQFIKYKQLLFGPETTIALDQIASIESGMAGMQQIIIETTGGKKIKMPVKLKDKQNLIDAIYNVKAKK
jgi:hypothetical protein